MKTKAKKLFMSILALILVLTLLAGCSNGSSDEPKNDGGNNEEVNNSGDEKVSSKDTLTIGAFGEAQSLFPANDGKVPGAQFAANVYETLVQMDKEGNIYPVLAETYEQIDDLSYKFVLKKGVKFHNGEELKASDVVFSMKHFCENPRTKSNTIGFDPDNFEIIDDYTLILRTSTPFAPFIRSICNVNLGIFNEKFYNENVDNIDMVACGTGPFKFVEWNQGANIEIERFDDYHGEKAKLKTINIRLIPEANSRLLELETGGIDIMQDVPGISLEQVESNPELSLYTNESVAVTFLALNFDRELLSNTKIRRAIAHAIDNDALRKACLMDAALTANSFLPSTVPGYKADTAAFGYDVEKAKSLLAEAGYPDGISFPLAFYQSSDNRRVGEVLQAMLKEANIDLELSEMETSTYTPFLNSREQFAAITTLNNTLRDPNYTLSKLYSDAQGVGGNRVNYNNPEMDDLLNRASSESDWDKRVELYDEIQELMYEDTVWIPLYSAKVCIGTTSTLRGYTMEFPMNYQNYAACYFAE
ncbi:ABC transporter substrate-binding protein [Sedimentibacter hydroxybenzoicus DSM 7310]|uniref:ABC transporter substrate-binding protein n=1 Tax=Sedimentibacter hydroxybenzoicus DSM 7310 TaxID=1123245 RepID=A0A974GX73_SEDHY|nr:ABC transporter substrate-binding protein [Sedimentibacter hydroxybenzoicus]NYB75279.1 ABC transporter substrate-binding protein [Sedimentibacter hydroxybenzoicus DSM 7310]